jgi:hypothetical protein
MTGSRRYKKQAGRRAAEKISVTGEKTNEQSITPPIPSEWMGLAEEMTISSL